MRANEFLAELDPGFVNGEIRAQNANKSKAVWKHKGRGATASVWQHFDDPTTVVKVVGGGEYESFQHERGSTLAFVHFCVDHGWQSPHFPIIHGINVDDDEVLQVRIESLKELGDDIAYSCSSLANDVKYQRSEQNIKMSMDELQNSLMDKRKRYRKQNSAQSILKAIQLLYRAIPVYAEAHGLPELRLDLHAGNWLARPNGVVVAADPWYCNTSYADRPNGGDSDDETDRSTSKSF